MISIRYKICTLILPYLLGCRTLKINAWMKGPITETKVRMGLWFGYSAKRQMRNYGQHFAENTFDRLCGVCAILLVPCYVMHEYVCAYSL